MFVRKICKVKPDVNKCCCCIDEQISMHMYKDCSCCEHATGNYELIDIKPGWFGKDMVYVMKDGIIKRVKLDRVFGVKYVCEEDPMYG